MKKSICLILIIFFCIYIVGCNNTKQASVGSSSTSTYNYTKPQPDVNSDRKYWAECAREKTDITTKMYLENFLDSYEEFYKAEDKDGIPAVAFALFGYLDSGFAKGSTEQMIADLGWAAIGELYQGNVAEFRQHAISIKWESKRLNDSIDKYSSEAWNSYSNHGTSYTSKPTKAPTAKPTVAPTMIPQSVYQLIADDDYASITFIGCELSGYSYSGKYNVCFLFENKTDKELIARVNSIAINGWTLTDAFVYQEIAPKSKAIVKISTDELKELKVSSVSGTLTLSDKSKELWGTLIRDYAFSETIK